jgi:hypothetical protein
MKTFFTACLLTLSLNTFCQVQDSVRTETTTTLDSTANRLLDNREKYRVNEFWQAFREERTLFKLGFFGIPILGSRYEAGVEQKVAPAWSVGASYAVFHSRNPSIERVQTEGIFYGRWYYRMSRRLREGKRANNLSGNYLMFRFSTPIYAHYQIRNPTFQPDGDPNAMRSTIGLMWGMQRRLGKWGYLDFHTGIARGWGDINPLFPFPNRLLFGLRMMLGLGL